MMKVRSLLIAVAVLGGSRAASAAQAPDAAAAAEAQRPAAPASGALGPLRVGVIGGVGFPRPLAVEGMVEVSRIVAAGVEYGVLPVVTVDGVSAALWSLAGDLRVFPLRGAFFVGVRVGRQHVSATTTVVIGSLGSATEVLDLDSWYVNPRLGFLWTMRGGLTFGVDAGVQVPLSPSVSSTLPLSLYPPAQHTVDVLGRGVLPTVDLLRVGLLL